MSESVRFDRAAEFYDRTRATSEDAMARTLELLASELGRRGRVLEVGVGTGLLALPLHERGVDVAGLDISAPMLGKLVEKAGGSPPFPLVESDATRMPFLDSTFGAAYLRWVLHLIADWRAVVAEIARVVRPGGAVIVNMGGFDLTWEIVDRFLEASGGIAFAIGLDPRRTEWLDAAFEDHGAHVRLLPPVADTDSITIGAFLDEMDAGMHSWTWRVPEDVRRRVLPEIRAWAQHRFGSLDRAVEPEFDVVWRAYELP